MPLRPDLPPMPAISSEIIFTYDVVWEHSDIAWASRWDLYLYMGDDQVHWFSILNSLVIVLLLSGIVAMIMVRTLRRDLAEHLRKPNKRLFRCCGCPNIGRWSQRQSVGAEAAPPTTCSQVQQRRGERRAARGVGLETRAC